MNNIKTTSILGISLLSLSISHGASVLLNNSAANGTSNTSFTTPYVEDGVQITTSTGTVTWGDHDSNVAGTQVIDSLILSGDDGSITFSMVSGDFFSLDSITFFSSFIFNLNSDLTISGIDSDGAAIADVNFAGTAVTGATFGATELANFQSVQSVTLTATSSGGFFSAPTVLVDSFQVSVVTIPEPSSAALLGLGGIALIARRRRA